MTLAQYIQNQRTQAQLDSLARIQDDTREKMLRTLADIDSQYDDQAKKLITVSQHAGA